MTDAEYRAALEHELGIKAGLPDAEALLAAAAALVAARMVRPVNPRAAEQLAASRRLVARSLMENVRRAAA